MADFSDKEFVLAAVTEYGYSLENAHEDLKKDREVVLAAVTQDGSTLRYAHEDLRNDREIVLAAVTQDGNALKFAHDNLKNDEEFLYEINQIRKLEVDSDIFNYISDRIQIKIRENSDYLLEFEPVYIKPARS